MQMRSKRRASREFLHGLFRSYFVANPELAKHASYRLHEAKSLLPINDSASLALGYSAIEVGFKELLLKPAVTGFVHSSSAAPVIAEIVISRSTSRHFKRILDETLAFIGIADHGALKIGSRGEFSLGPHGANRGFAQRRPAPGRSGRAWRRRSCNSDSRIDHKPGLSLLLRLSGLQLDNGVVVAA